MKPSDVDRIISTVGIPYAYYQFPENTENPPPFICFHFPKNADVVADNTNFKHAELLVVELYTAEKDFALEWRVEQALSNAGLVWSREEHSIPGERLLVEVYHSWVWLDKSPEDTETMENGGDVPEWDGGSAEPGESAGEPDVADTGPDTPNAQPPPGADLMTNP